MASEESIIGILEGLNGRLLAADPGDREAIVEVGVALEELLGALATSPDAVTSLLTGSLEVLQGLHAGGLADPAAALGAVCNAVASLGQWLRGQTEGREAISLADAAAGLKAALGGGQSAAENADSRPDPAETQAEAEPAAEPAEPQAEPAAEPSEPEAAAEETPAAEQPQPDGEPGPAEPASAGEAGGGSSIEGIATPVILPAETDVGLLREFIVECLDHIANAEACLLDLESDPSNTEHVNTIFRAFHTIKGTSGFLGLDHIQRLAHLAENQLDRARDGEIHITGGYADLALQACDTLRGMIEALQDAEPGGELPLPENLPQLLGDLSDPEGAGISEEAPSEELRLGEILVGRAQVDRQVVEQALQEQGAKPLGKVLTEKGAAKATDVAKALRAQGQRGKSLAEATVRVGTERLDNLINMVGELVIAQSMVAQDPLVADGKHFRLAKNVSHAGKIVRELQDLTMSLRMVPLKGLFQKMARLVRDLGRKAGKSVRFVPEGQETEIDRNMVEALNDPLVHMMRNSVDHGLEPADERTAAGKDPTGTVYLRAYHSAGNVVIEIQDDGRGLNREKILAKGIERGLVSEGRSLSDSEVFNLIFQPGFSTAEKITDVSGRGVGMDVVKRGLESMRGRVEVASTPGRGTTFTIRLPLTMAITDAMLVRVGAQRYLLPTVSIEQSFRPEKGSISTVSGRTEMVMLRGDLLPVIRLHRLFNVPEAVENVEEGLFIVIEGEGRRCALMVDELLGQQQVVIKSLGDGIGRIPGVAGGAILGDGRVGLILDAAGILQLAENCDVGPASEAA